MLLLRRSLILLSCLLSAAALADVAPDPTLSGSFKTSTGEYRFPASLDPDIIGDRATEVWAQVYYPAAVSGPLPLLVFLHGNHGTCGTGSNPRRDTNCQYTTLGTCPSGFVVTPNHLGYSYVAERLASWGYIVVSINANRGITCGGAFPGDSGLNLARGRLILKHLQYLSDWNNNGGTPPSVGTDLMGRLDFSQFGMMGHSRGGEGVRAAYNLYRDSGSPWPARIIDPISFQAIFEIGPVDGQTSRVLNADGTKWNVLLPMCDGDVSDLQGVKPFDRMMRIFTEVPATQKSTFTAWGTNHNYYNTEWQVSDSAGCLDHTPLFAQPVGSPEQRQVSLTGMMALFRANVGAQADPSFNQNFNPQYDLPASLTSITRVDRGFTDSPNSGVTTVFEDFTAATGTSTYGFPNDAVGIGVNHGTVPNHAPTQRAGQISWTSPGGYFQTNWAGIGLGTDITSFRTLDIRVSRQFSGLNGPILSSTNFTIQLALADGTLSSEANLSTYTDLTGPVGGPSRHPILQTARISLTDFATDLTQVRGVRLNFTDTPSGAIYVANIRLSTLTGSGATQAGNAGKVMSTMDKSGASPDLVVSQGNAVTIRNASESAAAGFEIVVTNKTQGFTPQNSLAVLRIGEREFTLGRYPENGDIHTMIFSLSSDEFNQVQAGEDVVVVNGAAVYEFGKLKK